MARNMIDVFLKDKSSVRFLSEEIIDYVPLKEGGITLKLKPNRTNKEERTATIDEGNFSRAIVSTGCRVSEYLHWEDFSGFMEFFSKEENRNQEYCF